MAVSSKKCVCLGTRMVVLTGGDPKEGLLVVDDEDDKDATKTLRIRIGTACTTYCGTIPLAQVKLPGDNHHLLSKYLLQDGREHPNISISFQYDTNTNTNKNGNSNNNDALKLVIQQRLVSSGLMKLAFSGILRKATSDTNNGSTILGFCHSLGRAVNDARTDISDLQQQLADTQQALKSWKDTAEALDRDVWQQEKDALLDNFLTLWNEGQTRAKQRMDTMQDELLLAQTKAAAAAATSTNLSKKQRAASRALQLDAPDDLDQPSQEPISLEHVAALAQGRKTHAPARQREPILDASQMVSVSTLKQQAEEYQKRKDSKKKKVTNSRTMEEENSPPPATKRAKIKKKEESDDSSDHDQEQENSDEEAMRMAIRASIRKPDDDDDKDESDASF